MHSQRFFQLLLFLGTTLAMLGTLLFFKQGTLPLMAMNHHLVAQNTNTYLGPNQKVPGNPQLIRIQLLINDDPNPQGIQILQVEFNQRNVPLKPRDIYGSRGQASFQLPPGTYKLSWKMKMDEHTWPRTKTREEEVTVSPKDLWLQITIIGDQATIS